MKLSSIRIQGMHTVQDKTYPLNRINYFYGKNGAGKSTIMQAVQLALLGYIPGTDKKKSAIFRHCNGHHMSVELTLSNEDGTNVVINRSWTRKGKDVSASVVTTPEDIDIAAIIGELSLPILNFNEFIGMTSNKLKDWFINFLPSNDAAVDWDYQLRSCLDGYGKLLDPEFVNSTIKFAVNMKYPTLEGIRHLNASLKDSLSYDKAELKRIQDTIQSLVFYEDCPTNVGIESLQQEKKELELLNTSITRNLTLYNSNAKIYAQLKQLTDVVMDSLEEDNRYTENNQNIEAADKVIADCTSDINLWTSEVTSRQQQVKDKQAVIDGAGVCPYSNTTCEAIVKMIDVFKADVETLNTEIAAYSEKIQSRQMEKTAATQQKLGCERANNHLAQQYKQAETLKKQIAPGLENVSEEQFYKSQKEVTDKIKQIDEAIIKIEANKQYNKLNDKLTAEKYALEQTIEITKEWIKLTDVNGLQSSVMVAPFHKLATTMSKYLNMLFGCEDLSAAFQITQEANSFSFGIRDASNMYIEFDMLSSGEKCLYTLSLLLGLIESSDTQLPIILIDDLLDHLDSAKIDNCFETLYDNNEVQVLLAGVQKCNHANAAEFVVEV